jgi:hypothetical protein
VLLESGELKADKSALEKKLSRKSMRLENCLLMLTAAKENSERLSNNMIKQETANKLLKREIEDLKQTIQAEAHTKQRSLQSPSGSGAGVAASPSVFMALNASPSSQPHTPDGMGSPGTDGDAHLAPRGSRIVKPIKGGTSSVDAVIAQATAGKKSSKVARPAAILDPDADSGPVAAASASASYTSSSRRAEDDMLKGLGVTPSTATSTQRAAVSAAVKSGATAASVAAGNSAAGQPLGPDGKPLPSGKSFWSSLFG